MSDRETRLSAKTVYISKTYVYTRNNLRFVTTEIVNEHFGNHLQPTYVLLEKMSKQNGVAQVCHWTFSLLQVFVFGVINLILFKVSYCAMCDLIFSRNG